MADPIAAPRGTFDVLPQQSALRGDIERVVRELLESAGYGRIETPAFESTDLFARGVGAATDIVQKEMYTFDDGGGRSLTLRPEGTAPVCRAYVEHGMHKLPAPVKLYYLSSFFRRERAQAGRFRQFWQIGAEALGSDDPALDAESIELLSALLTRLGAGGLRLRLSSLGAPSARAAYREQLQAYLREHEQALAPEVRARIALNPLRAFDADDPGTRSVMKVAPRLLDQLDATDSEHFAQVRALLKRAGVDYEIDSTLVRGLDYYTRTVFEFTSDRLGAQSGVGGGGRYDGLVEQLGGPHTAGVGWAAGIERIILAAGVEPTAAPALDLFVAHEDSRGPALGALLAARRAGLSAQMELAGRSLKGQFKHASRLNARYVALVSEGTIELRDTSAATRVQVSEATLLEHIK